MTGIAKQSFILIFLSVLAILFKLQLVKGLETLLYVHNQIATALATIFADDRTGQLIQSILALTLIPLFIGFLIAIVFWLIKRKEMPHIMMTIWIVWTVLLVTMLAQAG